MQAVGGALGGAGPIHAAPLALDVAIEGIQVCAGGRRDPLRRGRARARPCRATEVEYEITLPGEGAETEVFFSDLSHEYVTDQRGVHDVSTHTCADGAMRDVATLLEALPYIREFHGKTVVIKYGGAAMEDTALREEFARDVVLLKYVGLNPIVVHGGGPEITAYMERLGLPVRVRRRPARLRRGHGRGREDGARRQGQQGDRAAPRAATASPRSACAATTARCSASPAAPAPGGEDIGFVGRIERVNVGVIEHVASDYIPVIASVGADREGSSYNVNADEAAGAVAGALGAYKVIFLTDVPRLAARPGRSREPDRPGQRRAGARMRSASCEGGMRPKLEACVDAIERRRQRRAHPRRAHRRTRCCWSCSPTRGSAPRSRPSP